MSVACVKFIDRVEAPFRIVKTHTVDEVRKWLHEISEDLSTIEKDILEHLLNNKNFHDYYYSIDTTKVIKNLENPPGKKNLTKKEEKIKTIFLKLLKEILGMWENLEDSVKKSAIKIILIFCEAFEFLYALIPDISFKTYIRTQLFHGNI